MPWQTEPSLPKPRALFAAATSDAPAPGAGTWIYAIGGGTDPGPTVVGLRHAGYCGAISAKTCLATCKNQPVAVGP